MHLNLNILHLTKTTKQKKLVWPITPVQSEFYEYYSVPEYYMFSKLEYCICQHTHYYKVLCHHATTAYSMFTIIKFNLTIFCCYDVNWCIFNTMTMQHFQLTAPAKCCCSYRWSIQQHKLTAVFTVCCHLNWPGLMFSALFVKTYRKTRSKEATATIHCSRIYLRSVERLCKQSSWIITQRTATPTPECWLIENKQESEDPVIKCLGLLWVTDNRNSRDIILSSRNPVIMSMQID